jgi:hypothetical protein
MAHIREIHDDTGDLVDLVYFCSDSCNRDWHPNGVVAQGVEPYGGWYGCQEIESDEECAGCGDIIRGYDSHTSQEAN